jgi:hypothetical protein
MATIISNLQICRNLTRSACCALAITSIFSCRERNADDGALKIISSKAFITNPHPNLRLLRNIAKKKYCTAFFITARGAVTAGHCAPEGKWQGKCGVSVDGVEPDNCFSAVYKERDGSSREIGSFDIAYLVFKAPGATQRLFPNGFTSPPLGDVPSGSYSFELQGYGENFMKRDSSGKLIPVDTNFSGIEGDHTGIEGDHTGIEGDLVGIEGDHTGIEGDHSGIDGLTFNSARDPNLVKITEKPFACNSTFSEDSARRNAKGNTIRFSANDNNNRCRNWLRIVLKRTNGPARCRDDVQRAIN